MKFISLFAGVGGFDLGMERAGHECVAQVEWDKNAAGVLKRRWPDVPLFCDVSKVTADDLPDCDFITYGFPCQDLAVAGKRKGLEGERSGLFFEACRIIKGLAERAIRRGGAGGGRFLALAENVPGIFSSGNGLDFAGCIRELLDIGASEVGWTVLDTQHVGWRSPCGRVVRAAPQRRRRVFISATFGHFGEGTAGEIFSQQSRLRRYFEKGGKTGEDSPSDAGSGFTPGSFGGYEEGVGTLRSQGGDLGGGSETLAVKTYDPQAIGNIVESGVSGTITRNTGSGGETQTPALVVQGCDVFNGEETGETAATVTSATGIANASGPKVMASIQNCTRGKDQNGLGVTEGDSPVYTLGGADQHAVCSWNGDVTPKASEDVSVTLRSQQGGEGVGVAHVGEGPCYENHPGDSRVADSGETCPTITKRCGTGGGNLPFVMKDQNLTVRGLTPVEVMRLQGFDDDHCDERCELELVGNEWKATGKVVKQADGPIYKQAGNAVTVNVAEWIGRRLKRLQATYTPEELEELGVGTTCPQTLGEYLREREDRG